MKRVAPVLAVLLATGCGAGADITTEQGEEFERLFTIFVAIAAVVVLGIWSAVVWCVIRYRRKPDEDSLPNQGGDRPKLEIGLMLGPLVIVAVLFALSVVGERRINDRSDDPDLVVEVVSPGTSRRDRGEKLALYAESGIKEYWIVDPGERQVEFLVNEAGRFVVALPAGAEYRSRALPEIRLDLVALWREVDETLG